MHKTEPTSKDVGCDATTRAGNRCKHRRGPGSNYCWLHSVSRVTNAPWYKNSNVHTWMAFVLTVVCGYYFFSRGSTAEKQDEQLVLQRKEESHLTTIEKRVEAALSQQNSVLRSGGADLMAFDFVSAFHEVANQSHVTPQAVELSVSEWVARNQNSPDPSQRARAGFLRRDFLHSAELFDQAAVEEMQHADGPAADHAKRISAAVANLQRSGEAFRAAGQLPEALIRFEKALSYVNRTESAEKWGDLQNWVGICHYDLAAGALETIRGLTQTLRCVLFEPRWRSALENSCIKCGRLP